MVFLPQNIQKMKLYEFKHNIDTEGGASGSPIILIRTSKVVEIHKSGHINNNNPTNFWTSILEIFKVINNNYIIGDMNALSNPKYQKN